MSDETLQRIQEFCEFVLREFTEAAEKVEKMYKILRELASVSAENIKERICKQKEWAVKQAPVLYVLLLDKRSRVHRIRNNC